MKTMKTTETIEKTEKTRTIVLTKEQRKKLMNALEEVRDDEKFNRDIEISDELVIHVEGGVDIEGYTEDDYYNGTGGFVETSRSAWIDLTAWVLDNENADAEECHVDVLTEVEASRYLNEAA